MAGNRQLYCKTPNNLYVCITNISKTFKLEIAPAIYLEESMNPEEFDRLSLPKASANENLESVSRAKLALLMPLEFFELRNENERDKGIDLVAELKKNGRYTNFRFAIQLKATYTTVYNEDGSISFAVNLSNINYLMNYGMPAYFILYEHSRGLFYRVNAYVIHEEISEKYKGKAVPKTYSIRFKDVLDNAELTKIYDHIMSHGLLLRSLNPILQVNLQQSKLNATVVINERQQVYTVEQKFNFLEKFGYVLINNAEFEKIMQLEQECYPLPRISDNFHFVCGTAYYYSANMYKAIDHFKKAQRAVDELHPEMLSVLTYYLEMARYALGIIDAEKIGHVVSELMHTEYLGLFLQLDKAYIGYMTSEESEAEKLTQFYARINYVKNQKGCDDNLVLIADSKTLLVEGHLLNDANARRLMMVRALRYDFLDPDEQDRAKMIVDYNQKFAALTERALTVKNFSTYYIICLDGIKIRYTSTFIANYINHYDEATGKSPIVIPDEECTVIDQQCEFLDKAAQYYTEHLFMENTVAVLSQKYDLLHYRGKMESAGQVAAKMLEIIETNDLQGLRHNYEALINGGTLHEKFLNFLRERFEKVNQVKAERERLIKEMQEMDKADMATRRAFPKPNHQVQLYPLGIYVFPKSALEAFLSIIKTTETAAAQIRNILDMGIVPVANVFNNPVESEGYAAGITDYEGIETQRHIHGIRKALFEQGFFKIR